MNTEVKGFLNEAINNNADVKIHIIGTEEINGKHYAKYEMLVAWDGEAKAKQIRDNEKRMIANAIR
jgi:hypothetical protein